MTPPAYHLRTNKAIDRFAFIETIRRIASPKELSECTYYGFGGPYLEDFRLLHENFPGMKMVSIEKSDEVFKRQIFHLPSGQIKLRRTDLGSFLARYDSKDRKSIFWLDYTALEYSQFEEFMLLLTKVASGSMVKITLRSRPNDFYDKEDKFREKFEAVLPNANVVPPRDFLGFARLLQDMLQIASQKALPSGNGFAYQPVSSFCYKDGVGILTLTGVVCSKEDRRAIKAQFSGWPYANLYWGKPKRIDVPFLSTKERLHLQQHLPCVQDVGRKLIRILGYKIDDDRSIALDQMKQYADFYIQYPYFIRAYP